MTDGPQVLRARAAAEQANADSAILVNVRERAERSARAWAEMAERAERTTAQRHAREAATVAKTAQN